MTVPLPMATREGTCEPRRCGSACCSWMFLEVNPIYRTMPDVANWVRLHGIDLVERNGRTLAKLPIPCTMLAPNGDCALHGLPERPRMCADFPVVEGDLFGVEDVCSYRFHMRA